MLIKLKLIDVRSAGYIKPPNRAYPNDAGADVFSPETVSVEPGKTVTVPLGFGVELPAGYMACVYPKSGLSAKGIISQLPPIDSGYTGEIHAFISNLSEETYTITAGDKIGQLVITPVVISEFTFCDTQARGGNGLGSTGK